MERGGYLFVVGPGHAGVLEANCRTQESLGVKVELHGSRAHRGALSVDALRRPRARRAFAAKTAGSIRTASCRGFAEEGAGAGVRFSRSRGRCLRRRRRACTELELASGTRVEADAVDQRGRLLGGFHRQARRHGPAGESDAPLRALRGARRGAAADAAHQGPGAAGHPPRRQGLLGRAWCARTSRAASTSTSTRTISRSVVWPACASRIPAFEELKLKREWAGLYDECELDGNMILGNWPGQARELLRRLRVLRPWPDACAGGRPRARPS